MQNVGIAMLILLLTFPAPLGDLATLGPMASAMMTPIPPFIVAILYNVYRKLCKTYEPVNVHDEEMKVENKTEVEKLSSV